jgi:hypothetical protein
MRVWHAHACILLRTGGDLNDDRWPIASPTKRPAQRGRM